MMKILLCLLVFLCIACQQKPSDKALNSSAIEIASDFTKVDIDIVKRGSISVRALEVTDTEVLFAEDKGSYGIMSLDTGKWRMISERYAVVEKDSVLGTEKKVEKPVPFRSIARTEGFVFVMSIGSPAKLSRFNTTTGVIDIVYEEHHPKAFYDSMAFWNDKEGIAMGDPTDDCLSVIITRDSGNSWQKISCDVLPKVVEGEAAFAASDTNIKIIGDETWMVSGGKQSRVFYSPNKGRTWEVVNTPIIQGEATQGAYSMDFSDRNNGILYGGDYTNPSMNSNNIAITTDGGKTWNVTGSGSNDGYKSCVQFVPNSQGKKLVAVGFTGISYSKDGGANWTEISKEPFLSFRFLNEHVAYAGGRDRVAKLSFR